MEESLQLFLLPWLVLNLIAFIVMGIDKRNAIKNKRRTSESTLLLLAFAYGALGVLTAMFVFRHKTRKPLFLILVPTALLLNVLMTVGLYRMI